MRLFLIRLCATALLLGIGEADRSQAASAAGWHVLAPVRTPPIFYQPSGIAVDTAGRMFVPDAATGTVTALAPSARPLAVFGPAGSSSGVLARPSGIARASGGTGGTLYVADPGKAQIVEFTSGGTLVRRLSVPGVPARTVSRPIAGTSTYLTLTSQLAIAVGARGNILTLQPSGPGRFTLRRFSPIGTSLGSTPVTLHTAVNTSFSEAEGLEYIMTPLGVAVTRAGTQFLSLEEQVCSISRDNRCRAYQVLQKRTAAGAWAGEWVVTQTEVGPSQTTGLAIDRSGNVLVPSPQDNAIYTFTPAGARLHAFKPAAPGAGDFSDIGGITASASGTLYLVGTRDRTVQKLSPAGVRLALWGKRQSDNFAFPGRLAVDRTGTIYLAEGMHGYVKKLRRDGTTAASWPDPKWPVAIAASRNGDIYVADQTGGVREVSPSGKQVRTWGTTGRGPGQFRGPGGIAVDAGGNVYVADTFNHRIEKFSSRGAFLTQWGSRGTRPGQFEDPGGMTISPAGNLYVADTGNGRIQEFSPSGTFLAAYPVPRAPWEPASTAVYPTSVAVDAAGHIFTAYDTAAVVEIIPGDAPRFFGGPGLLPGQFTRAYGVAVDASGALYVTDITQYARDNRIEKLLSQ